MRTEASVAINNGWKATMGKMWERWDADRWINDTDGEVCFVDSDSQRCKYVVSFN